MATVTGPLMSMIASGKFGGAIKFDKRGYAGVLVTPSNPRTVGQADARQRMKNTQAALKIAGPTCVSLLKVAAPTGYRWNSNIVKLTIGVLNANYDAAETAYALLSAGNHTSWDGAFVSVITAAVPGSPVVEAASGFAAFALCSALFNEGIITSPGTPGAANHAAWYTALTT